MGIFVPWLADAARLTGYPVVELSGWKARGHGGMTSVEGVVLHHTAGPKTGEYPSLAVVRDGRAGLAGPLANFGLGRSGTVYVNAAGLAYHAGVSEWAGMGDLNGRFLGIEAEDDGDGIWTGEQIDCYPRLVAACLYYMRRDASRACAHRECAPTRKIDPTGFDMPALRSRVADMLADPLRRIPHPPTPAPTAPAPPITEDDEMFIRYRPDPNKPAVLALLSGPMFVGLGGAEAASAETAIAKGAVVLDVGTVTWGELDKRSHALCDNPRPVVAVVPPPKP